MKKRCIAFMVSFALSVIIMPVFAADGESPQTYEIDGNRIIFSYDPNKYQGASVCTLAPHKMDITETGFCFVPECEGRFVISIGEWTEENNLIDETDYLYGIEYADGNISVSFLDSVHGSFDATNDQDKEDAFVAAVETYQYDWLKMQYYFEVSYFCNVEMPPAYHMFHVVSDTPLVCKKHGNIQISQHHVYDSLADMQQNATEIHYNTTIHANNEAFDCTCGGLLIGSGRIAFLDASKDYPVLYQMNVENQDLVFDSLTVIEYDSKQSCDVNNDNLLNMSDVVLIQRYVSCDEIHGNFEWKNADVNQDGVLNSVDCTLAKRLLMNI